MAKVVYNACFGGFSLSYVAVMRYAELRGIKIYGFVSPITSRGFGDMIPVDPAKADDEFCIHYKTDPDPKNEDSYFSDRDIERNDPALIQVIEELGEKANGQYAQLVIKEIPDGSRYRIDEYDGNESVETPDSYDWKTA